MLGNGGRRVPLRVLLGRAPFSGASVEASSLAAEAVGLEETLVDVDGAHELQDRSGVLWRDAFLGYFTTGVANNGGTEAINGLIELARRVARGLRDPHNYCLRMLLIGGGLRL